MGHTHYNELAHDGRTLYAAARSVGQNEDGSVGYAVAAIDGAVTSWRFKPLDRALALRDDHEPGRPAPRHAPPRIAAPRRPDRGPRPRAHGPAAGRVVLPRPASTAGPWRPMVRRADRRRFHASRSRGRRARAGSPSRLRTAPGDADTEVIEPVRPDRRRRPRRIRAPGQRRLPTRAWPEKGSAATSSGRTATAATGRRAETTPRPPSNHLTNDPADQTDRGRLDPMGALTLTPNLATWAIAAARDPRRDRAAVLLAGGDLGRARRRAPSSSSACCPAGTAWEGVLKGTDVYLFLVGMMLMSEVARKEGLFDWLAGIAVRAAKGSATRLFTLIYRGRHRRHGLPVERCLRGGADARPSTPPPRPPRSRTRCPTSSSAPSSPTRRASCCRSRTRPTSWSSPSTCRRWRSGSAMFALPSVLAIVATYAVLRLTQSSGPARPDGRHRRRGGAACRAPASSPASASSPPAAC